MCLTSKWCSFFPRESLAVSSTRKLSLCGAGGSSLTVSFTCQVMHRILLKKTKSVFLTRELMYCLPHQGTHALSSSSENSFTVSFHYRTHSLCPTVQYLKVYSPYRSHARDLESSSRCCLVSSLPLHFLFIYYFLEGGGGGEESTRLLVLAVCTAVCPLQSGLSIAHFQLLRKKKKLAIVLMLVFSRLYD